MLLNHIQFEALISTTIEETKDIPEIISETGKIGMPHKGLQTCTIVGDVYRLTLACVPRRYYAADWTAIPATNEHQFCWICSRFTGEYGPYVHIYRACAETCTLNLFQEVFWVSHRRLDLFEMVRLIRALRVFPTCNRCTMLHEVISKFLNESTY